ncbi:GNAT family N-acetyltransferase [Erythrobacter sp. JK5]|uniref:GNAT family N-acetyltransferase n=1 Tax=Erythrobacter sp. JK5 TaxID=2829500 RepID=UPI001BA44E9C|nr:GNAT family N-acetyltransferase [Erythrobacter sp. JK5]QUL38081.1 GNAT family N-acetyltransferase [Erythrobacter sp. JK5]
MEIALRPPHAAELPAASALCLRSKAHWGYDQAFIDACRNELTLTPADLAESAVALALSGDTMVGLGQISHKSGVAELDKLFVEPEWIGRGIGKVLFDWSTGKARSLGARTMLVTADPYAVPFYEKMGFELIGEEPSASIPGRVLPVYRLTL